MTALAPAPVLQPLGSRQCGQACIASLAGVDLATAVAAVGKKGGTWRKHLEHGLLKLRGLRLVRSHKPVKFGIARIHWGEIRKGHWLAIIDGKMHDPWPGGVGPGWHVASYFEAVP